MDFVEEIDYNELNFEEIVGKGAFGVVRRATYQGESVAVKLIETETEKKAFITELKQLSRVSHPNIVKLYGACTQHPVCLVMEYAEGGSLYNVLHGAGPQPNYSAAHAISWALQCAKGVEYLHSMKPKALIHRDLKPPNLLLIMGGTVLKICDFGTACDIQTHMTNNKGSAAWMAPEVFEGSNYSEKCDVFSWGIILWEIVTRKKPFDEMGGPAFRIMWAVHLGTRPPLIRNLPRPLELLMTRCWSGKHVERPSMAEVARIMTRLSEFFHGADLPLVYPQQPDIEHNDTPYRSPPVTSSNYFATPGSNVQTYTSPPGKTGTFSDTVCQDMDGGDQNVSPLPPVVCNHRQISAPASLAASCESLADNRSPRAITVDHNKRYSADNSNWQDDFHPEIFTRISTPGHRRSSSYGNTIPNQIYEVVPRSIDDVLKPFAAPGHRRSRSYGNTIPNQIYEVVPRSINDVFIPFAAPGHRRSRSYGNTIPNQIYEVVPRSINDVLIPFAGSDVSSGHGSSTSSTPRSSSPVKTPQHGSSTPDMNQPPRTTEHYQIIADGIRSQWNPPTWDSMLNSDKFNPHMQLGQLDHQRQPLAPCPTSKESMDIYNKHISLANDYMQVKMNINYLKRRKQELIEDYGSEEMNHNSPGTNDEYFELYSEYQNLMLLHGNLKKQVQQIKRD